MASETYRHAELGFGFELPDGWRIDAESSTPLFPAIVSVRSGERRIMIAVRATTAADPAARIAAMREDLAARGIGRAEPVEPISFGGLGNVVAVELYAGGQRQRWISLVVDSLEFSFTHTQPFDEVHGAFERIASTFKPPPPDQARRFVAARQVTTPGILAGGAPEGSHYQRVAARFNVPAPPAPSWQALLRKLLNKR